MQRQGLVLAASFLVVASTCGVGAVTSAEAATHGSVTWSFSSSRIKAGTPVQVTYRATGVRPRSSIAFERQFGTAHVWKSVATFPLSSLSTTVNLPPVPVGDFIYKVRVTTGRTVDFYSARRWLYSYGPVTLTTMCHSTTSGGGCGIGSVQLQNSTIYNYEMVTGTYAKTSPGSTALSFPNTSCRSGVLTLETGFPNARVLNDTTYVQVTQSASDPQITSLPDTSQTVFNFKLDGGPFDIDAWHSGGNEDAANVYFSGTFDCYTLNGLR